MAETCKRHEGLGVIGKCQVCGVGICRECREEFGYFCSKDCLRKSSSSVDPVAKLNTQRKLEDGFRFERLLGLCFKIAGGLALLGIGFLIWSFFLSPYGKLAWRWDGKVSTEAFIRFDAPGERLLLLSGPYATVFDAAKGKPVAGAQGESIEKLDKFSGLLSGGAVLYGHSCVGIMAQDATLLWFKEFKEQNVKAIALGGDSVIVALDKDFSHLDAKRPLEDLSSLLAISGKDGSILWTRQIPKDEIILSLCAANGRFAYSGFTVEKEQYKNFLKVCDSATGEPAWQIKLNTRTTAAPFFAGDAIVFSNGDSMNAVSVDGSNKLWSVKSRPHSFMEDYKKISGSFLVFLGDTGLVCVDLKEQRILWKKDFGFSFSSFHLDSGRLIALGYQRDAAPIIQDDEKKPSTMEDLKDAEMTSVGVMNKMAKGFKKESPSLLAIDLKTGVALWRHEHAVGRLVCGSGRAALVVDTAKDLMISMIGGSQKGDICVTQIDLSSGKKSAEGSDSIGLTEPFAIFGSNLVGVIYDREVSGPGLGMGKVPLPRYLGLAAFKLK